MPADALEVQRVLVFNCLKERDPAVLLPTLAKGLAMSGAPISQV